VAKKNVVFKKNLCIVVGVAVVCWCVPVEAQQVEVQEKPLTEISATESNGADLTKSGPEAEVAPAN
jgi:hypothetical protein